MKLTLFTISNEQIKEQLSKLQTKVESLETVKEVQDKIISTKDSQISFLNDSIANMWQPIAIVAAIAGLVITGAFAYVSILHHQAKKKRKEVEELIQQSHSISTVAQERLEELEEKQKELNKLSSSLANNQKVDITLNNIKFTLDFISKSLMTLYSNTYDTYLSEPTEQQEEYSRFKNNYERLGQQYIKISLNFNKKIISGESANQQDIEVINNLENKCVELKTKIYDYLENL
ncbi:hypothetical protein CN975_28445 [Bacillus cereus]|uniref:hypothetical protein n=1 Tax=Bacillus TaxID=1386 RepID=UPI000BF9A62A|nr:MULTISPECIES: hypothetical protein [Bacillus]KAF6697964.1 hypothetical protein HFD78_18320 [Bacillus sp. EKM501B]MEB9543782.1 hypothetical protein [Bacillus cereus]PER00925.1 hypothetical protein CN477_23030 [Bacillus cereus]PER04313.1 hypothetical protein CN483_00085 [Bacillus cereus]PEX04957.1 hypothetical protein CN453_05535 [Bacillus cereus]